jgi:hypothetical protein
MAEIIYDMPEEQYHAETGLGEGLWVTRSMVHMAIKSMHRFWLTHVIKHPVILRKIQEKKEATHFRFGSFLEAYINGTFAERYAKELPCPPYEGKGAKARREEWKVANAAHMGSRLGYTDSHLELAALCVRSLEEMTPLRVKNAREGGIHEAVARWHDEETGLPMQVRFDTILDKTILDWKHTSKSLHKFHSSADDYGYITQEVMYSDGFNAVTGSPPDRFLFPVMGVGEASNYEADIIELQRSAVEIVASQYRAAIRNIANEQWHTAKTTATVADVPAYWYHANDKEEGGL